MKLSEFSIDDLIRAMDDLDCSKHPQRALELSNEIERRKAMGERPTICVDNIKIFRQEKHGGEQEIGIFLSAIIIIIFILYAYLTINVSGSNYQVLVSGGWPILFGILSLLCYYIPHKSIVLKLAFVLISFGFAWLYILGGEDEVLLYASITGFAMGALFISIGIIFALSGNTLSFFM